MVERLNRFIIGQDEAKKAVAIAFRNRWRRHRVPEEVQEEIVPKNILMIGPTGCGKTEIARRLAKLADSPFVKVEATKFTEVGYHGRDVDQIIRDLLENAITLVRQKMREAAKEQIDAAVEQRVLDSFGYQQGPPQDELRERYRKGELEGEEINVEMPSSRGGPPDMSNLMGPGMGNVININLEKMFGGAKKERRRMTVAQARPILEDAEAERLFPLEAVIKEALRATEQDGIVFIDEIDKIVSTGDYRHSSDPSSEGVQRDLLPIIEGSTVSTRHGNVKTDHILFICSGAFHSSKPSDMLAELQGRLPIRVELKALSQQDMYRILTEPEYNMIQQQRLLLETEGVELQFTEDAIREIARVAEEVNRSVENIGARRLHTVLERIVEEVSFSAPELVAEARERGEDKHVHVVDKEVVVQRVGALLRKQDLSKYIL